MTRDPTLQEMRAFLSSYTGTSEFEFDVEAAIYWYSVHYHGGQGSNLYLAICTSPYRPGMFEVNIPNEAEHLYLALQQEFGPSDIVETIDRRTRNVL